MLVIHVLITEIQIDKNYISPDKKENPWGTIWFYIHILNKTNQVDVDSTKATLLSILPPYFNTNFQGFEFGKVFHDIWHNPS